MSDKKYMYCSRCEEHPDKIQEKVSTESIRSWNGTEYEINKDYDDDTTCEYFCSYCGEELDEEVAT